jgi:hypothetical protein
MKEHDTRVLQLMQLLAKDYTFSPCENSVLHKHVLVRSINKPAIYVNHHLSSIRPIAYTPPRLLVLSGVNYGSNLGTSIDNARTDLTRYLQATYDTVKDVYEETGDKYLVFHLLVHNAHILYESSVPNYLRVADDEGVVIPAQPAYKILAFEVSMVAYNAQDPNDFELKQYEQN